MLLKAPHEKTEGRQGAVFQKHKKHGKHPSGRSHANRDHLALVAGCRICCSRRINTCRVELKRLGSICSLLKPLYYAKSSFNYNETRQGGRPWKG